MSDSEQPRPRRVLLHYHLAGEFPDELKRLHDVFPEVELTVADSQEQFAREFPQAEVVVAPPLPSTTLDRALSDQESGRPANLRAHVVPFAGVDRAPVEWYRTHEVLLASSHGNADSVAERAVALMYAAAGRVVEFDQDLRRGAWHRREDPVHPFDYWRSLTGARVAILGAGAIGCRIAELVAPLAHGSSAAGSGELVGLHRGSHSVTERILTAQHVSIGEELSRTPEQFFDRLTTRVEEALFGADVVIVALPLTSHTRGSLTRDLFGGTNRAVLVNVSRAEIIPEDELYTALTDGTLEAAGLDVWYNHPQPFNADGETAMPATRPFHQLANVVLSPHAASHSELGKRAQLTGALAHVEEYLKTGSISRAVDPGKGY